MAGNEFLIDKLVREGAVTIDPSSNYQPGYEPSKMQNFWTDYVYRSAAGTKNANIDITLDGVTSVQTSGCALYGLNLTSSYQTLKLQKWTGSWVDIGNFEYDAVKGRAVISYTAISHIKYRVVMADTNVASYVQCGFALLGLRKALSRGFDYGAKDEYIDTSRHAFSKAGYLTVQTGYETRIRTLSYDLMSNDEANLQAVWNAVKKRNAFAFYENYTSDTQRLATMQLMIMVKGIPWNQENDYFKALTIAMQDLEVR